MGVSLDPAGRYDTIDTYGTVDPIVSTDSHDMDETVALP